MILTNSEIQVLSIGISIFIFAIVLILSSNIINKNYSYTNEYQFIVKKWLYILGVIVLNIGACAFVYYTNNLRVILYIIFILKSKYIIMSIIFVGNMMYKPFKKKSNINSLEISDNFDKILSFIPVYKETNQELTKTVDSIINNQIGQNYLMLCIISDGFSNYSSLLDEVVREKQYYYKSWLLQTISVKIHYGKRHGKPIIIITKVQHHGKKDSIILCNDLFNYKRNNIDDMTLSMRNEIYNDLFELFNINGNFDYIFRTYATTYIDPNVLIELIDSIKQRNAVASCGIVNIDKSINGIFWNNLQNFQYLYVQYMYRTNEDVFSQVLCLPGCISMIKIIPECSQSLELFSKHPDKKTLIELNVQCNGTDLRYTSSIIYSNQNQKIVINQNVHAYNKAPQNWKSFNNKYQKWYNNIYFNNINNIISPNVNVILRFFNLVDYLRLTFIYFRLFNNVYLILLLVNYFQGNNILDIVPFIINLCFPIFCFFIYCLTNSHLRKQYYSLLLGYILNKIITFPTTIIFFTIMLINIGTSN